MEDERRQEILKAEETIRQLAAEMARVSRTAAEVDIVKLKLENAHSALEQAKASLDSAEEFSSKVIRELEVRTAQLRRIVTWAVVLSAAATIVGVAGLILPRVR